MDGDFFHDGKNVLSKVREWHVYIKASLRKSDHITSSILDLTEKELLIPNRTITARKLYMELKKRLDDHKGAGFPEGLESLMETLLELDNEALSVPSQNASTISAKLPQLSTINRLDVPVQLLKTAARNGSLSKLSRGGSAPEHVPYEEGDRPSNQNWVNPSVRRRTTIKSDDEALPDPKNVIQAREQMKGDWFNLKVDGYVETHFDNRDIVSRSLHVLG